MSTEDAKARAGAYGLANDMEIDFLNLLGTGQEGFVWKTDRNSAIKVFDRYSNFERELKCYQILQKHKVNEIIGFTIPELIKSDQSLRIIEMSIVSPPYILDFGKAYVCRPPDYPSDLLADYEAEREELFEGNWALVESAIASLRAFKIYYSDARPGNINCKNHPDSVAGS